MGEHGKRGSDVVADLERLRMASAAELRALWEKQRGTPPPRTLSARLMRLVLAWDAQARATGAESAAQQRAWEAVIRRRADGVGPEEALSGMAPPAASAGTRLMKIWGGETHEVIVLEDGVLWHGRTYASLSAVARAITGTRRNGPRFFGLRERVA